MQINGNLLIGGQDVPGSPSRFHALDPVTGQQLAPAFGSAGEQDIALACELAEQAFDIYRATLPEQRAQLLERIALGIEALGDTLVERAMAETALPRARLEGERGRTTAQLRLFASVLRAGQWQQATFDTAQPRRQPARRPDLRMQQIALGPVAVFGASNFPLAFCVAGGDTASALAAGCPVVVKAHPAHPGTAELVGRVVQKAAHECGLPAGVFALVGGPGHEVGEQLVRHPAIQAVGFTGSRAGGLALCRVAQARPQPIPVYAEMSAINPVFLLPAALAARGAGIAQAYVDSLVLGGGQFCTNPGIVLGIEGPAWQDFVEAVARIVADKPASTLLSAGIQAAYRRGTQRLSALPLRRVAQGQAGRGPCDAQAMVHETTALRFMATPALHEEVFGPSGLLVRCANAAEMRQVAERLEGQLTATLQLDDEDVALAQSLLPVLERKAGRILANGFPTGVEVSHAMVHGGPFPATSDSRSTSVGAAAIARFLRPVCYQDLPDALLPPALKSGNPLQVRRLIDGLPVEPELPT